MYHAVPTSRYTKPVHTNANKSIPALVMDPEQDKGTLYEHVLSRSSSHLKVFSVLPFHQHVFLTHGLHVAHALRSEPVEPR